MYVHKFGGTSVADAACIANAAEIIVKQHRLNPAAVVVSALSGVTDQLLAGGWAAAEGRDRDYREIKAGLLSRHLEVVDSLLGGSPQRLEVSGMIEDRLHELERLYRSIAILGEFTPRGCDAVASIGEILSASLLAAALSQMGERAQAISAVELIVTDAHFGEAHPLAELTHARLHARLLPLVERGVIPVITGYIGATESGATTTLGRGGGDYSAALVGAGLEAQEVWIWSDVNGILTADPSIVPGARSLAELSYSEAAALAYYGADVLHPKTIQPVTASGIPLRILNSFNPQHPGTLIVAQPQSGRPVLPAIISTSGLSLIAVGTSDDAWSQADAARALLLLQEAAVNVPLFAQSFAEHSLNLVVRAQDQVHCLNVLRSAFANGKGWVDAVEPLASSNGAYRLGVRQQVAMVSVVGFPGWSGGNVVSQAFMALGKHGTHVIAVAQAGTQQGVSFCIPHAQVESTVLFLHQALGLD